MGFPGYDESRKRAVSRIVGLDDLRRERPDRTASPAESECQAVSQVFWVVFDLVYDIVETIVATIAMLWFNRL